MRRRLGAASMAVFVLASLVACGPVLSDSQRLWCRTYGHVTNETLSLISELAGQAEPVHDNLVAAAAVGLDVSVPPALIARDSAVRSDSLVDSAGNDWEEQLEQWRGTGDYARVCIAAYQLR